MWFKSKDKIKEEIDNMIEKARNEREKENILEALAILEKAIHLDKEYATPYGEYGIVLAMQKNNNERAEYNGHMAVIKNSKNSIQWRNLAHIYYLIGNYTKAYISILVAEILDPTFANVQKIKSTVQMIIKKDSIYSVERMQESTWKIFSKYQNQDTIIPERFFEEILID